MAIPLPEDATIRSIIQAQAAAWLAGDPDAIADAFADPCEFISPSLNATSPNDVRRAAAAYFEGYDVIRVQITEVIVEGSQAAVVWEWEERDRRTGELGHASDTILVKVRGGKIAYWRECIDGPSNKSQTRGA